MRPTIAYVIGKMAAPSVECPKTEHDESNENKHNMPKVHRYNWLSEHPKYVEMKSWCLGNDEQLFITLIVYLNLCEAKDWWNITIHPCKELCLAFITGKPTKKGHVRYVLPISPETQLSQKRLKQFLEHICQPLPAPLNPSNDTDTTLQEDDKPSSLILAITESGSTIVYYQISNGLVPPSDHPQKDEDAEDEPSKVSTRLPAKRPRKQRKKGGLAELQETVADCKKEEEQDDYHDEFMPEDL